MQRKMLTILATIAAMIVVSSAASAPPAPTRTLPPQAAERAAHAPGLTVAGQVRKAALSEVAAAASVPGTVTEGTLDTGRSLQKVGRRSETDGTVCYHARPSDTWGSYPYEQTVIQSTYWCARGGLLTYRSTAIQMDSTICTPHDAGQQRVQGGVGTAWVTVAGWSYFSCSTIVPWAPINTFDYAEWQYGAMGLYGESYRN